MRKIERLRKEALESCKLRGHSMIPFTHTDRHWRNSECRACGKTVYITINPLPNEIEIGGEAVALDCQDSNCDAERPSERAMRQSAEQALSHTITRQVIHDARE